MKERILLRINIINMNMQMNVSKIKIFDWLIHEKIKRSSIPFHTTFHTLCSIFNAQHSISIQPSLSFYLTPHTSNFTPHTSHLKFQISHHSTLSSQPQYQISNIFVSHILPAYRPVNTSSSSSHRHSPNSTSDTCKPVHHLPRQILPASGLLVLRRLNL